MEVEVRFLSVCSVAPVLLLAMAPMSAKAQLSDHHGVELASHGLGQSYPMASDVSQDPNWQVYGFERDGISYYQVNDLSGRVHLIVGRAGGSYWALPAGDMRVRASVPSRREPAPEGADSAVVYRHQDFLILRYGVGDEAMWSVELP
ncbi:hypothetical protein J7J08_01840 [Stenotrophomonas sp. ISL-67]|nr:hypothetical protein [Stenotrophomonas sp. ISL-67]